LNTPVREVQPLGDRVTIRLEDGTEIEAGSAVVAPGPWIREFVPELGKRLKLTRQPLLWFSPVMRRASRQRRCDGRRPHAQRRESWFPQALCPHIA
jgi:glycine/D-amino acid oxidase-like deaminating enzyme